MASIGSHHYCNFPIACRTRYGVTGLGRLDRVNAPFRLQVRVPQLEKSHSAIGESMLVMGCWSRTGRPQRQSVLHLCSNSSNNGALGFALSSTKWNSATYVSFGTFRSLSHMNAFQMCLIWACMDQRFHYLPISLWGSLSGPQKGIRAAPGTMYWPVRRVKKNESGQLR
ncbi:hypothetical protein J3E73DRAFT_435577 [Bipolaris maydis]|nr:hypothetical protein J3E73DRAFT_435577 [Bipolaris maydis]